MEALSAGVRTGAIVAANLTRQHGLQASIVAGGKPELHAHLGQQLQKCWRESTAPHYLESRHATKQEHGVIRTPRSRVGVHPRGQAC